LIGSSCVGLAVLLTRQTQRANEQAEAQRLAEQAASKEPRVEDYLATDPVELELGVGLVKLADRQRGGDLLRHVQSIRRDLASKLGIILPKVRIRDNLQLGRNEYRINIGGMPVAGGEVSPNRLLAIGPGTLEGDMPGLPTEDPAHGRPALWIEHDVRDRARQAGCTVVEPSGVIAEHLTATMARHADELLTRDATRHLIDELKKTSPTVVEELIPGAMKLAEVQQVLQMLLRENVSIRRLELILEALGDAALRTSDPIALVEHVRSRLARTLCAAYRDSENRLRAATLDPEIEDQIREGVERTEDGLCVRMSPQAVEEIRRHVAEQIEPLVQSNRPPVLLVEPLVRPAVRRITAAAMPELAVLSYNEITRDTIVESVGLVKA
ncbi:MAG: EscV/YscV/HrcV family type III secretion system export apparatus protein, partial [Pirellulaceae bacterium]|nr:EscV/YscV/HrcV family type III secretion system export apparatus protein [Pirellulaceae bacterium]